MFRVLLVPAIAAALLAGCASAPEGLTLVETKSPVQLLRNEAWYRLPAVMVKDDEETTDVSVACQSAAEDPEGIERAWTSSTVALINNSFAPRVEGVGVELVASFVEQGWTATTETTDESVVTVLEKADSVASIRIEATPKSAEHRASLRISATGPCVQTDGADSEEVRSLEGPS